jgi:beta-phosphoglucomutase
MLGAVIFDFDGVITDSEILHLRAFNKVLGRYGFEITTKDYYTNYLGLTDHDLLELLAEKGLLKITAEQRKILAEQKKHAFEQLARTGGKIIKGVREFLLMLSRNNIPMAICSGALLAEIELILEDARLRRFFDVLVSAEQVKKGKPHPDGFVLTLQKLNEKMQKPLLPGQCIVVEDSHWGLEAAKAAGMHTVAVTNSYGPEQLCVAEKIVANLADLSIAELRGLCG